MSSKKYRDFFVETREGQDFVKSLGDLIGLQHEKAEKNPELSRDYTQRAKGVREVIDKINVLCVKKGEAKG